MWSCTWACTRSRPKQRKRKSWCAHLMLLIVKSNITGWLSYIVMYLQERNPWGSSKILCDSHKLMKAAADHLVLQFRPPLLPQFVDLAAIKLAFVIWEPGKCEVNLQADGNGCRDDRNRHQKPLNSRNQEVGFLNVYCLRDSGEEDHFYEEAHSRNCHGKPEEDVGNWDHPCFGHLLEDKPPAHAY